MENSVPFVLSKIMDVGSSHPFIARIGIGLHELLEFSELPKSIKQELSALFFDIAKEMVEAEKQAIPIIREIEAIELQLEKSKPQTIPSVLPHVIHLENTRGFLKFAKEALRKLTWALSTMLGLTSKGPKFLEIKKKLEEKFSNQDLENLWIYKTVNHYQPAADDLVRRRNEDEHRNTYSKPFLRNYEITLYKDVGILQCPCFESDKKPIYAFLIESLHLLLHCVEETLVGAISLELRPEVIITEIPPHQRNPHNPKRFRLDLFPETLNRTIKNENQFFRQSKSIRSIQRN